MSFNAPPPPPPQQFPEFGPEPTPPKKGKGAAILIGAVAVVVIGVLAVGAMWFLNKSAKPDSMAAPTNAAPAVEPSATPSAKASATPSATPSDKPSASSTASPGAATWSKAPSPTPTPVETHASAEPSTESVEDYRAAERQRLSFQHCARGNIVVLAETAKHIVSICDVDGSLYYRGQGKKSGANMDLPAYNGGGSAYEASNSSTEYYFDRNRLTVTTGSKVQLDDPIISYRDLSYGNWE